MNKLSPNTRKYRPMLTWISSKIARTATGSTRNRRAGHAGAETEKEYSPAEMRLEKMRHSVAVRCFSTS